MTSVGNYSFTGFTKLTSITWGGVIKINSYAFKGCTSLPSISLPIGMKLIGEYCFDGCTGATSIDYPNSIEIHSIYSFHGCTNAQTLNIIGEGPMQNYESNKEPWYHLRYIVSTVNLGDKITSIGNYAFKNAYKLESITIPDSVTSIGSVAFTGSGLKSITIPETVTELAVYVFSTCRQLESVIWNTPQNYIPRQMFEYTPLLKSFTIKSTIKRIEQWAFRDSGLTSVIIPSSVTSIQEHAFVNSTSLESVQFPNNQMTFVTNIFEGCERLTTLKIIGERHMKDCTTETDQPWYSIRKQITTIIIGDKVRTIGAYSFVETAITTIEILASVTSINTGSFKSSGSYQEG